VNKKEKNAKTIDKLKLNILIKSIIPPPKYPIHFILAAKAASIPATASSK
jgi:hypothetical protein